MSGLIAILAVIQVMVLAGQSVAREKEQGTFDQLLVTPLGPAGIMLGKALPPVLVGIGQSTIVLLAALKWFAIPFAGSFGLLYAGLFIFNCSVVGIGLCVSALTSTMQQAVLFGFSLLLPMILLSGFVAPVTSMPMMLQLATLLNPVRYGVELVQRIYLEGVGFQGIYLVFARLAAIAVVTLGVASKLFRSHLN
jgi:ABC-2 type transport system permease protein